MADVADWKEVGALIDKITEIANISSVDLVDRIALIDLITKITTITTVSTITAITNILNIDSLDLIDRITLIDEITKIGVAYITDYVDPAIIYFDTFADAPINWVVFGTGTVARDTTYAYKGAASLKVTTPATASLASYARRYDGLVAAGELKLSLRGALPAASLEYMTIEVDVRDGTTVYIARVRYDVANAKWQYNNSLGAWADMTGGAQDLQAGAQAWHYIELGLNFSTGKYGTFKCDNLSIDLSAQSMQTFTPATENIETLLGGSPSAAAAIDFYFDNIKLEKVS
uniref:Uncharacterized protein n=1 Tax=viral metagenome TaxID=1070528 RepID=A0A6H2A105_9ZZZZ